MNEETQPISENSIAEKKAKYALAMQAGGGKPPESINLVQDLPASFRERTDANEFLSEFNFSEDRIKAILDQAYPSS